MTLSNICVKIIAWCIVIFLLIKRKYYYVKNGHWSHDRAVKKAIRNEVRNRRPTRPPPPPMPPCKPPRKTERIQHKCYFEPVGDRAHENYACASCGKEATGQTWLNLTTTAIKTNRNIGSCQEEPDQPPEPVKRPEIAIY